jgi:hypothetical protein
MSPVMEQKQFETTKRHGDEVITKINANSKATNAFHEAVTKHDKAAVVRILAEYGLENVQSDRLTLNNWKDSFKSKQQGGAAQPEVLVCTKWVYWLTITYDPWGGIDWQVHEGCAALEER